MKDLQVLGYPQRPWVLPRSNQNGNPILDVLIVGAGQSGLAIASALKRERVDNILVIDENPRGQAGPWRTFARMPTLRTPKYVTGLDLGIPSLTFEAWLGEEKFSELKFIPTEMWAQYLDWYRDALQIPLQHNTEAGTIQWRDDERCFVVNNFFARKIVLATGIDGCGKWNIPKLISVHIPKEFYAHTREQINFDQLKKKSIAVLGAGASSFDNGVMALEHGCHDVHVYYRRDSLPNVNPYRWTEFVGFLNHHSDLSDADKWRFIKKIIDMGQLPPHDTFARAKKYENFYLHASSPWLDVRQDKDRILIRTPQGEFEHDFIIVGTGFKTDLSLRSELSLIQSHIARWQDRFTPSDPQDDLLQHPYLGAHFEFQEKSPGMTPWISSIFCYTFGGLLSHGFSGGSISGLKYSLPKLISGITSQLYRDDLELHYRSLCEFDLKEY